jgi:hypothetical protein
MNKNDQKTNETPTVGSEVWFLHDPGDGVKRFQRAEVVATLDNERIGVHQMGYNHCEVIPVSDLVDQ